MMTAKEKNERSKEYRHKYNKDRLLRLRSNGICVACGTEDAESGHTRCNRCLMKNRMNEKIRRENMTQEEKDKIKKGMRDRYYRLKKKYV